MLFILITSILFLRFYTHGNYNLYEVTAYNMHERALLYYVHLKNPAVIFMNGVSNEAAIPMDVIVKSDTAETFENKLHSFDIQFTFVSHISSDQLLNKNRIFSFNISNTFYDWEGILKWINKYEKKTSLFRKTVIAKTFEKRDIFILSITKEKKKPIVFIVGGEDGMDWMSSALVFNLFDDLLNSQSRIHALLSKYDFYLLPILNPDGFDYSQKKDRLWSKNRKVIYPQTKCPDGNYAIGINLSRNWFLQKPSRMIDEQCYSVNFGHKAQSEEETEALSYILNSVALDMIAFIHVKGFGRYITVPFSHSQGTSNNHDIILEILRSTCYKIQEEHKVSYYLGTTADYFYNFSGNMADWVKFKLNTPLVYTVYLENEDTVLPITRHIKALKKQLVTILNESLVINYDIYGPLFNSNVQILSVFKINLCAILLFSLFH